MSPKLWLTIGAVYGFLAVACGAFGAHALRERLSPEMLAIYRTAVEYHFYHAFALIAVGVFALLRPTASVNLAGMCFAIGVLFFSGSLYALAFSGLRMLGAVTPVGGLLFLIGWAAFAWSVWRAA